MQKFVSVHASMHVHFNCERHFVDGQTYKLRRSAALAECQSLMARSLDVLAVAVCGGDALALD